jgi:hypothetical protein
VREEELADRQKEDYLNKKKENKEEEEKFPEYIAEDTEEDAYDPDANPYEGVPYRNGKSPISKRSEVHILIFFA